MFNVIPPTVLLRLDLGPPVTSTLVAAGLSSRPSGVAPNADNKLIYICADSELEVICFNGGPRIRTPRPPFEIHSIQFFGRGAGAIKLKDHIAGADVPLPEFVQGTPQQARCVRDGQHAPCTCGSPQTPRLQSWPLYDWRHGELGRNQMEDRHAGCSTLLA